MIDDLTTLGTAEPYRMFTSRAEYRTLLRQDNADFRLTELGAQIGLATEERLNMMLEKKSKVDEVKRIMAEYGISGEEGNTFLRENNSAELTERTKALKLLLRPGIGIKEMIAAIPGLASRIGTVDPLVLEQVEIQAKYDVYIEKEQELVSKMAALEHLTIPETFDYDRLTAMSAEARQKLNKIKPATLGQASRISGVNPSDVQILMVYMGR